LIFVAKTHAYTKPLTSNRRLLSRDAFGIQIK